MQSELANRLVERALDVARRRRCVPTATYRLQMHRGFTIRDALAIVPYLHSLGVSHVYTSSLLAARPGSMHGYDVIDHSRLNPELGTDADLATWVEALHACGMGLILDVVPNHMCVNGGANAWWADVLEHGPSSPFANHFDIAWNDHPRESLRGKVLLPILGEMYGKTLESGAFRPEFEAGAFHFQLGETRLPIDPRTYGKVLNPALDEARVRLGAGSEAVLELQSILMAVTHLPARGETDSAIIREGRYEMAVVKRRLAELAARAPEIDGFLRKSLTRLAGTVGNPSSFTALDEWLEAQAYRPAFWRVASDEINYRRFFDVNDLAAISVERDDVFAATHGKIFEWLASGAVDGLRIDHPDGLYDPKQYLDRLQLHYLLALARREFEGSADEWSELLPVLSELLNPALAERLLYVVVEKILASGEKVPADWCAQGTTGYEFLNAVNALFVDRAGEAGMTAEFERFTGFDTPYEELAYRSKFLILQTSLASELHVLAHGLDRLAQMDRGSRDFTLNTLRHALREVIACFPVYRSYVTDDGASESDRLLILRGIIRARRRNPVLGRSIFDFIRDTLLLKNPPSGPASEAYRYAQRSFAGKFQQVTSPVMAKGLEDTAFYIFNRLTSLNEVGGEPGTLGATVAATHGAFAERAKEAPRALSALSTHDTKRGEDVRARINVLSEIPAEWSARATRWAERNRHHKTALEEGQLAPDANEEYLLYQTLVGTWVAGESPSSSFTDRIREYMHKVVHEAKVHTSWINPDAEYDAAIGAFVARILDPELSSDFLRDLTEFSRGIARPAALNSLAQTLLRCTAPGVPDTYQGTELGGDSLVDPDNRRPVDYGRAARILHGLDAGNVPLLAERMKLLIVSRALRLRRTRPELFDGDYVALESTGLRREHLFAFVRRAGAASVLVAVPRLMAGADFDRQGQGVTREWWGDTALAVPAGAWRCAWTGQPLRQISSQIPAADLFAMFSVALFVSE